jgi:hypothetical protein
MSKLSHFVVEFLKREDGPTAVEYDMAPQRGGV